ncbi:MAG: hypothetical protein ACFFDC_11525 [Promethearchaeota archaeon]
MKEKKERPLGVALIAIFFMILGVNGFLSSIEILLVWRFPPSWALISFIFGLIFFLEGYGIWKLNFIAYIIIMAALVFIFFAVLFYRELIGLISDLQAAVYLILMTGIILYLLRVRDHF